MVLNIFNLKTNNAEIIKNKKFKFIIVLPRELRIKFILSSLKKLKIKFFFLKKNKNYTFNKLV